MDHYILEQVGNIPVQFDVRIENPDTPTWTATAFTENSLRRLNMLLQLRIVGGPRAGWVGIGVVSGDGRTISGRLPFTAQA